MSSSSILYAHAGGDSSNEDLVQVEQQLLESVNEGNKAKLHELLSDEEKSDAVLKALLTTVYANDDKFYTHDADIVNDAHALLGPSVKNLNILHICCMLGEEEMGIEILEFLHKVTAELESKKLLLEFIGRVWGDGNNVLHLASFTGMADLVKKLLELGALPNKRNERQYKPVDCAADEITCEAFNHVINDALPGRKVSLNLVADQKEPQLRTVRSNEEVRIGLGDVSASNTSLSGEEKKTRKHSKSVGTDDRKKTPLLGTVMAGLEFGGASLDSMKRGSSNSLVPILATSKPKRSSGRRIRFDPVSTILFICQFGEDPTLNIETLRELTKDKSVLEDIRTGHQFLSPLHLACAYNQPQIVRFLLEECGVCVNVFDKEGWTPLHSACVEGNAEIVELLGRCQGRLGDEKNPEHPEWIYVQDGPIWLEPLNEDEETPQELAEDKEAHVCVKLLKDLKKKYPPPAPGTPDESIDDQDDEDETEAEEASSESEEAEPERPSPIRRQVTLSAPQTKQRSPKKTVDSESDEEKEKPKPSQVIHVISPLKNLKHITENRQEHDDAAEDKSQAESPLRRQVTHSAPKAKVVKIGLGLKTAESTSMENLYFSAESLDGQFSDNSKKAECDKKESKPVEKTSVKEETIVREEATSKETPETKTDVNTDTKAESKESKETKETKTVQIVEPPAKERTTTQELPELPAKVTPQTTPQKVSAVSQAAKVFSQAPASPTKPSTPLKKSSPSNSTEFKSKIPTPVKTAPISSADVKLKPVAAMSAVHGGSQEKLSIPTPVSAPLPETIEKKEDKPLSSVRRLMAQFEQKK